MASDTAREICKEEEDILRGLEEALEGMCGWGIPEGQSVLGGGLEKATRKQDLSAVSPLHSTRGRQRPVPTGWAGSVQCRGGAPGVILTMTISPGIGVGSLSRNLTFSSLTGTRSARLSAEMVSSAGLLWGNAVSTAASVCGQVR